METTTLALIELLESELTVVKNETKAIGMSKYMKDKFCYFGISSTERREIQKKWFSNLLQLSHSEKWELVRELWLREEREFQYAAIDYLKKWKKSDWLEVDIHELEWLITQKSWWDSVDLIASNMLGVYFQIFPHQIELVVSEWMKSENTWLERSCLLFQLKYKDKLDFDLLKKLILQLQSKSEFFIQKAIGWILRSYANVAPDLVLDFVQEINLQGLAKREALRRIIK